LQYLKYRKLDGRCVITGHVNLLVALVVVDKWLILKVRTSFLSGH
jgi:hypothetical protein